MIRKSLQHLRFHWYHNLAEGHVFIYRHLCLFLTAILGVHTLVTSTQTYDGTSSKEGYNSEYTLLTNFFC